MFLGEVSGVTRGNGSTPHYTCSHVAEGQKSGLKQLTIKSKTVDDHKNLVIIRGFTQTEKIVVLKQIIRYEALKIYRCLALVPGFSRSGMEPEHLFGFLFVCLF